MPAHHAVRARAQVIHTDTFVVQDGLHRLFRERMNLADLDRIHLVAVAVSEAEYLLVRQASSELAREEVSQFAVDLALL